jgi:two-component system, OmpR family, phosphate regulon sensor histidine kinase PhoR
MMEKSFIGECIEKDGKQQLEANYEVITQDGELVAVSAVASPLHDKDQKVIGCVVVFRNVSKERAIDKSKSEFVSLASHQLRTPLSTIGWYTEMLLAGDAGKITKTQREYLDQVYVGNQRMVDLVNALLNVSRLDLGTFIIEPEQIAISEIAKGAVAELKALTNEKNIKINEEYEDLPEMNLDRKLTHIIFQNLLSNAVKYSPIDSEVDLSIKKKGKSVEVIVKDSGMGIPKQQQDKLFTKLFRAENAKHSDATGTGLGLYIVKQILDNSDGTIAVKSIQDKGTTFTVKLPLKGMKKKEGSKALS